MRKVILLLLISFLFQGCEPQEAAQPREYEGPLREVENVEMHYTENEVIKVKMTADRVYEYENGDQEFPSGIYLEFYTETGQLKSTLRANYAYHNKEEGRWKGQGKVEVKNLEKNEQLNTEELYWKPSEKKIFTESFVTIRMADEVIYGTGLEADEDFSSYSIQNPQGEFQVEE